MIKIIAVVFCLSSVLWPGLTEAQEVMILHTGFTSGSIYPCRCPSEPRGGLAKRATLIKQLTRDNGQSAKSGREFLLFDSGDLFNPFADRRTDSLALSAYKLMGYDAIAVGDQEISQGASAFLGLQKQHGLPFIAANLFYKDKLLAEPYKIIRLKKQRLNVGVVGVVQPDFYAATSNNAIPGLEMRPPIAALREVVSRLRSKVDLLILLSHVSNDTTRAIARAYPQFDLVISGGTQTGVNEIDSSSGIPILSAGIGGKYITQSRLEKSDGKWRLTGTKQVGVTSDLADDPEVLEAVGTEPPPILTNPSPPPPQSQPQPQQAQVQPPAPQPQAPKSVLTIDAFVARDCRDCQNLKKGLFADVALKYAPRIRIVYHEIDKPDEYNLLVAFENKRNDRNNKIPAVVLGNTILGGVDEIKMNLNKEIRKTLKMK